MKKLAIHWWILIAMALGVGYGFVAAQYGAGEHVTEYIGKVGDLFLNLLKMIAVPLVLFSLTAGVASLSDTRKLSRIGGKTIGLYLCTTAIAIAIGLLVANLLRPGSRLDPATRDRMRESLTGKFGAEAQEKAAAAKDLNLLDQLVDIVPQNPFKALTDSQLMIQVVFFALILGVALTRMPREKTQPTIDMFQTLADAVVKMVHFIMKIAPFGVFALMARVMVQVGEDPEEIGSFIRELGLYMATVVLGLFLHLVLVYGFLLRFVAKVPLRRFMRAMVPAQLLAFSSSSSAATLAVTIRCVEKDVGVHEEVTTFVLPLGATINMDGTGLYQGVAAFFVAALYNMDLSFAQQLQIVFTAALASIGTAAVPGVGIVMLTIVLGTIGVPAEGIAIVFGVDRILDMCRTVLNVTGDAAVATTVAASEGLLERPESES